MFNNSQEDISQISRKDFGNSFLSILLEIPDCPDKVYFQGQMVPNRKNTKFIAVVGSRNHSNYAHEALEKILSEISGYNIVIISGLALGIDSLAHRLALKNNLKTIAVPGSGLSEKVIYPRSNFSLAQDIINKQGLLLSEFEPDFKATPWSFPKRNRIMAGLADLVLVVEASEKSGTLITAKLALDYNKDLAVIPNSIFSEYSYGSNKLLKEGAHPIFSGQDILELLGLDFSSNPKQKELDLSNFSKEEQKILKLLSEPKSKSILQEESGLNITKLNTILSILEIKGVVREKLGKFRKKQEIY